MDGYEDAMSQESQSNTWSSTENNSNNAWNVNFNNGNSNNNNKYNSNVVRPVVASMDSDDWKEYLMFSKKCKDSVPQYFLNSIIEAYYDCCRGKGTSAQCMEYKTNAEYDLPILAWELWTNTYYPSTSTCFLVKYPKWREVFAANFRDRIVHHWLCLKVNPLFEQRFHSQGNVSYNCRKGFGTDKAVEGVIAGIKKVTCNYQKKAWVYKGDLVGCFMSIDKDIMWKLSEKFVIRHYHGIDKDILMRVMKIIIYHHPEKNCVLNSNPTWWENLPAKKSLFRSKNYCYARFVDDFVVVCDDKAFLKSSIPKLRNYLQNILHFQLHIDKHYFQEVSHGVQFVGSYIKNGRTYLSNRTIARMTERVHGFIKMMDSKELSTGDCARISTVMNSYLGFTRRKKTYNIRRKLMREFLLSKNFGRYFYVEGRYEIVRVKNKYKPFRLNLC